MTQLIHDEERIHFHNQELIAKINKMLEGVDEKEVLEKSPWIFQHSMEELQKNVAENKITYADLTAYYLIRIRDLDQCETGTNAVSEINENALEEARQMDASQQTLPLKGMPFLLKENINTSSMPTSAGAFGLQNFIPRTNAPIVEGLLKNGVIILGKANLSEMAYFMSEHNPSGYSAKKGQTHNPFNPLKISALGSSTGSAVAMAMDLAAATIGTETCGSITAPASVCSAVGYKPSHSVVNGEGIIPISYRLDTPGPITKTVEDAVMTFNAFDNKKWEVPVDSSYLQGKRIGLLKDYLSEGSFTEDVKGVFQKCGAQTVEVEIDDSAFDLMFVLNNDFQQDLNHYFATYHTPIHSLKELIVYNQEDPQVRMRYGQTILEECSQIETADEEKVQQIVKQTTEIIVRTLIDNQLDALVFENNRGAQLAALPGAPEVSVPFGIYEDSPCAVTFFGNAGDDEKLLKLAYSFQENTKKRQLPNSNA